MKLPDRKWPGVETPPESWIRPATCALAMTGGDYGHPCTHGYKVKRVMNFVNKPAARLEAGGQRSTTPACRSSWPSSQRFRSSPPP
jgi:hypothetical protein